MPLIVLVGKPCSGKSSIAKRLKKQLMEKDPNRNVRILCECEQFGTGHSRHDVYSVAQLEKEVRGKLKSSLSNALNQGGAGKDIIILDGLNYIKGYRYEIHCAAKESRCRQVTVECLIDEDDEISDQKQLKWNASRNDAYPEDVLLALNMRYEAPIGKNRWDAPLFRILSGDPGGEDWAQPIGCLEELSLALFGGKAPKPNRSTQNQPLSADDHIQRMDLLLRQISEQILEAQRGGSVDVEVGGQREKFLLPSETMSEGTLAHIRRQFISFSRQRPIETERIPSMFLRFLNSQLHSSGPSRLLSS